MDKQPNALLELANALKQASDTQTQAREIATLLTLGMKTIAASKNEVSNQLAQLNDAYSQVEAAIRSRLAELKDGEQGAPGRDGRDGVDGISPDIKDVAQAAAELIKLPEYRAPIMDGPQEIRDKLELLQGDERLDATAIKGLDELQTKVKEISARPSGGYSPSGPTLMVGGTKKGRALNLNFKAGSNVTVSHDYNNGQHDITIASTGGSGTFGIITVTGTINDTNVAFTAASTPNVAVVNGQVLRHGKGVTISGTSVTLDNPVGTGGDIYCL